MWEIVSLRFLNTNVLINRFYIDKISFTTDCLIPPYLSSPYSIIGFAYALKNLKRGFQEIQKSVLYAKLLKIANRF